MFFIGKYDIVSVSEQEQAELVQCERRTVIMIQIIIVERHMGGFPSGQRGQTVNLLQFASVVRIHLHPLAERHQLNIAGWSSLEARRAHNPKVVGSNPAPATHT